MIEAGVIEDYTYLWHDVRPHPNFGTVEVRVCDSQTQIEHTLALAALIQGLVRELSIHFDEGTAAVAVPVRDARREQVARRPARSRRRGRRPAERRARRDARARQAPDRPDARALSGSRLRRNELEAIEDLLTRGNGAARQIVVYEANHDLREVMAEIVAATAV